MMPLDAGQLKQQAVDELTAIDAEIEGLKGERATIDEKIAAAEVNRKEAQRIVSALTPRAKRGEGKKAQAKKRAAADQSPAEQAAGSNQPTPTVPGPAAPAPGEPSVDEALQAHVSASGTTPVEPFIPPAS